jgi:hypothetical protein
MSDDSGFSRYQRNGRPRLERPSRRRQILLDDERAETFRRIGALETGRDSGNLSRGSEPSTTAT